MLAKQPYKLGIRPTNRHQLANDVILDPWNLDRIHTFRLYQKPKIKKNTIKIGNGLHSIMKSYLDFYSIYHIAHFLLKTYDTHHCQSNPCCSREENSFHLNFKQKKMSLIKQFPIFLFQLDCIPSTHHNKLSDMRWTKNRTHTKRCSANDSLNVLECMNTCVSWLNL